jgi:hypothetical protein
MSAGAGWFTGATHSEGGELVAPVARFESFDLLCICCCYQEGHRCIRASLGRCDSCQGCRAMHDLCPRKVSVSRCLGQQALDGSAR